LGGGTRGTKGIYEGERRKEGKQRKEKHERERVKERKEIPLTKSAVFVDIW